MCSVGDKARLGPVLGAGGLAVVAVMAAAAAGGGSKGRGGGGGSTVGEGGADRDSICFLSEPRLSLVPTDSK